MSAVLVLIAVGMILVFVGMLMIILSLLRDVGRGGTAEFGGGVLIGPVPIVFGTSSRAIIVASVLMVLVMALALIAMLAIPYIASR